MTKNYYQLEDESGNVLYQGYDRDQLINQAEDDIEQEMADDGISGRREEIAIMSIIEVETGNSVETEEITLVAVNEVFNARDEWGTY